MLRTRDAGFETDHIVDTETHDRISVEKSREEFVSRHAEFDSVKKLYVFVDDFSF